MAETLSRIWDRFRNTASSTGKIFLLGSISKNTHAIIFSRFRLILSSTSKVWTRLSHHVSSYTRITWGIRNLILAAARLQGNRTLTLTGSSRIFLVGQNIQEGLARLKMRNRFALMMNSRIWGSVKSIFSITSRITGSYAASNASRGHLVERVLADLETLARLILWGQSSASSRARISGCPQSTFNSFARLRGTKLLSQGSRSILFSRELAHRSIGSCIKDIFQNLITVGSRVKGIRSDTRSSISKISIFFREMVSSTSEIFFSSSSQVVTIAHIGARLKLELVSWSRLFGGLSKQLSRSRIVSSLQSSNLTWSRISSRRLTSVALRAFLLARRRKGLISRTRVKTVLVSIENVLVRIAGRGRIAISSISEVFMREQNFLINRARLIDQNKKRISSYSLIWGDQPHARFDSVE